MTTTQNAAPTSVGTVLFTGPTGGLGRPTVLAMARRPEAERPDLLLLGRRGTALEELTEEVRAEGAVATAITADFSRLADVRAAADQVKSVLASGGVRPLRVITANAGVSVRDTHQASADGYERTFAVNYLAHAQLIGELIGLLDAPARIVLVGSNTYYLNTVRRLLSVPPAQWRDPIELAKPTPASDPATTRTAGVAYSNSKLALMYYAHELQRRVSDGINVSVFEPGFMPGTGLGREHGERMLRLGRALGRVPGVSTPAGSAPAFASVLLDDRWAHLRDGAFVVKTKPRAVKPFALDRTREARLWEATDTLLATAAAR